MRSPSNNLLQQQVLEAVRSKPLIKIERKQHSPVKQQINDLDFGYMEDLERKKMFMMIRLGHIRDPARLQPVHNYNKIPVLPTKKQRSPNATPSPKYKLSPKTQNPNDLSLPTMTQHIVEDPYQIEKIQNHTKQRLDRNLESDKDYDPEKEKQRLLLKRQKDIEESLSLNVKDHISKLESYLNELKKELEISKKDMANLRMEVQTLKDNHYKSGDDLSIFIQNDSKRVLNETIKRSQDMQHDFEFMESQIKVSKADQEKLQEVAITVEKRVISCETDVGFKHVYD